MARKTNTFKIEGYDRNFEVRELTVKQIIGLMQDDVMEAGTDILALKEIFSEKILPLASNVTMEDLMEMAPSDIQEFWDKFQEVNKVFFGWARQTGLPEVVDQLKMALLMDFGKLLASSLKPDTSTP